MEKKVYEIHYILKQYLSVMSDITLWISHVTLVKINNIEIHVSCTNKQNKSITHNSGEIQHIIVHLKMSALCYFQSWIWMIKSYEDLHILFSGRVVPDIRPNNRFHLPDIRPEKLFKSKKVLTTIIISIYNRAMH